VIYPESLRATGASGRVRLSGVLDTTGRLTLGAWRLTDSTDAHVAAAVRNAWARLRLPPARRATHPVAVAFDVTVEFVPPPDGLWRLPRPETTVAIGTDGDPRVTLRLYPEQDSTAPGAWDSAARHRALADVLQAAVPNDGPEAPVLCLSGTFDWAALRRVWPTGAARIVEPATCPPTRSSSMRVPGDAPPPAHWRDPWRLDIRRLEPWTDRLLIAALDAHRGMSTERWLCEFSTETRPEGTVRCRIVQQTLH
jgi:hypothetical protein